MIFRLGFVQEHESDFNPAPPWVALREPTPLFLNILAFPIAIVMALVMWVLWQDPAIFFVMTTYAFLPLIPFLIFFHELLHALAYPHFGFTHKTIIGFWPSRLMFYAYHDGEISRSRFLLVGLMPLVVMSLLPLILCRLTGYSNGWIGAVSFLNGIVSCGDILGAIIILSQVPHRSVVRNKGYRTFWKSVKG